MTFLALGGGICLALALVIRELQLIRERTMQINMLEQLRLSLESTRTQLRRHAEDLFVLQTLLVEHNLTTEAELVNSRVRLIETPRRLAEERSSIQRHLGVEPPHLVLEDSEGKIH